MKKLWKFEWEDDYSLIGGIFKTTDEEVNYLIGREIFLGEIAGKHSDVSGIIGQSEITLISDNPIVVEEMIEFGYNPLDYVE